MYAHVNKCKNNKIKFRKNKNKFKNSTLLLLERLSSRTKIVTNAGEDVGKKEPSYTIDGNVN
jgi:hypothetical protein